VASSERLKLWIFYVDGVMGARRHSWSQNASKKKFGLRRLVGLTGGYRTISDHDGDPGAALSAGPRTRIDPIPADRDSFFESRTD
jgi:hypothetical protein